MLLESRGLAEFAEVRLAPLVLRGGDLLPWYDLDLGSLPSAIDMVVIDGPPVTNDVLARAPAIDRLRSSLGAGCVVLLDDGNRGGEREIAERWARESGGVLEYIATERGAWRLVLPE